MPQVNILMEALHYILQQLMLTYKQPGLWSVAEHQYECNCTYDCSIKMNVLLECLYLTYSYITICSTLGYLWSSEHSPNLFGRKLEVTV